MTGEAVGAERKPVVMRSLEDASGLRCVDLVCHAGIWAWVECRRDPEDGHGWRRTGQRRDGFETEAEGWADAARHFAWIMDR